MRRHALRTQHHADFTPLAAENLSDRNILDGLHLPLDFCSNTSKLVVVVAAAPKRQSQYRHVVNRAGFDQGLRGARRYQVEIGIELVVELDDRVFFVLSYLEAN